MVSEMKKLNSERLGKIELQMHHARLAQRDICYFAERVGDQMTGDLIIRISQVLKCMSTAIEEITDHLNGE